MPQNNAPDFIPYQEETPDFIPAEQSQAAQPQTGSYQTHAGGQVQVAAQPEQSGAALARQMHSPVWVRNMTPTQREFQSQNVEPVLSGIADTASLLAPGAGAVGWPEAAATVGRTAAGGYLGQRLGEHFLGTPGKIAGGLVGGYLGYNGLQVPGEIPGASLMNKVIGKAPELGTPENPGFMAKLPTRMPKAPSVEPELGSPENPGWVVKLPNRMPKPPDEAGAVDVGAPTMPKPTGPGVAYVSEPRPLQAGEKPGSMYSVPREELIPAGVRGKPGAIEVMRDLGQPTLVIPKEAGYPGPRPAEQEAIERPPLASKLSETLKRAKAHKAEE